MRPKVLKEFNYVSCEVKNGHTFDLRLNLPSKNFSSTSNPSTFLMILMYIKQLQFIISLRFSYTAVVEQSIRAFASHAEG